MDDCGSAEDFLVSFSDSVESLRDVLSPDAPADAVDDEDDDDVDVAGGGGGGRGLSTNVAVAVACDDAS